MKKKTRTSVGITITLKARKLLKDEQVELALREVVEHLAKGLPRVAASFGGGGTPTYYMGTFPAFLSAWGPIDFSFGSGQGVKCVHSEHLYGELWHRAFTVAGDTPNGKYLLSFGQNVGLGQPLSN